MPAQGLRNRMEVPVCPPGSISRRTECAVRRIVRSDVERDGLYNAMISEVGCFPSCRLPT
jgi:hypothetical protein